MRKYTNRELHELFTDRDRVRAMEGTADLMAAYEEYNVAKKCAGCDAIMVEGGTYCWKCGLNLTDIEQFIIDYNTQWVVPVSGKRMYSKEMAAAARKWLTTVLRGKHGISITISRGSSHIYVKLPQTVHDCVTQSPDWKPWDPMRATCPVCTRHDKATRNLNHMLVRRFPGSENKSDYMSDYHDFTWLVV